MSLNIGTLTALLRLDAKDFADKADKAVAKIEKIGDEMRSMATDIAIVGLAVAAAGAYAIKAASDFEETTNLIAVGFGSASLETEAWAKTTASSVGRSTQQMRDFAGRMQSMLGPLTGNQKAAAGMSKEMAKLAVDLGSFFNVADEDALASLRSGLSGEAEPLKKFGIVMLENTLKAFAHEKGIRKSVSAMSEGEKVALRYAFIMEKSSIAHDDASETANSFANQLKRAHGTVNDLAVAIGQPLLNALGPVLQAFNSIGGALSQMTPGMAELVAKLGLIAGGGALALAALLGMGGALAALTAALPVIAAGLVTLFGTILPIVVIIGAVIVMIGLFYKAWVQVKDQVIEIVGEIAGYLVRAFQTVAERAGRALTWLAEMQASVWTLIIGTIVDALTAIPRAIFSVLDNVADAMFELVVKLKPALETLGMGDVADNTIKGLSSLRQELKRARTDVVDFGENVKEFLTVDSSGLGGSMADFIANFEVRGALEDLGHALMGAGMEVGEGILMGAEGVMEMVAKLIGVDLAKEAAAQAAGTDTDFGGSASPAGKGKKFKSDTDATKGLHAPEKSLGSLLRTMLADAEAFGGVDLGDEGGRLADSGAGILDSLMGGDLPSLTDLGTTIGNAIAPGIGGQIGAAIGGAIQAIADAIQALALQIFDGLVSMAETVGAIILSGAQKTSDVAGGISAGASFAGTAGATAGAAAGLGAILGAITAVVVSIAASIGATVVVILSPFLLILIPIFAALAVVAGLVAAAFALIWYPVIFLASMFLWLGVTIALAVGAFVALLQIGTATETFKRFSLALEWGSRQIIAAVEPMFAALMPVAGVMVVLLETIAMLATVFLRLLEASGAFEFIFEAFRFAAVMALEFGKYLLIGVESFLKMMEHIADVLNLDDLEDSMDEAGDGVGDMIDGLDDALDTLRDMTLESAGAYAESAAAAEELAQAMDDVTGGTMNLPEAFKLAAARRDATGEDSATGGRRPGGPGSTSDFLDRWFEAIGQQEPPQVVVYINGEESEDLQRDMDRIGRVRATIRTGIPLALPRRRWGPPGRGN